jgi:hypothetical protein
MVLGTLGIRDASADVLRSLRENAESKVILEKRQTTQNFTMDDVLEIGKLENVNWINCIWSENYSIPELTPITEAEQSDNLFTVHFQNKVENDSVFEEKIYRLTEGNFPQNNNEIVINQLLAEQNGLKIGDRISEDFLIVGFFLSGTERQQTDKVDTVNRIENQIYGMNDAWQNTESEKLTKIVCYVKEPELLSELADELEVQYGENAYVKADDNTYQKIKLSVKQTDRITLLVLAITLVTGCIVTGLLLSMWMHRAPEEEWRYVPDAHEPIVSRELFDKVQRIFADRAESYGRKVEKNAEAREKVKNYFKNKIFCGDCGKRMRFIKPSDRRREGGQDNATYACGGYLDSGYRRCSRHGIRYPVVADAVFAVIREQVNLALEQEQLVRQMRGTAREKHLIDSYVGQINYLAQELKKINGRREALYENFAEGVLDEAEYQFAKKKYDEQADMVQKKLSEAKQKKRQLYEVLTLDNGWLKAMHEAQNVDGIHAGLVDALVRSVKIYEDKRIEVELNYGEQKSVFEKVILEMEGEGRE